MAVFDSHLHIVAPGFPIDSSDGYEPEPFPVSAYRSRAERLGITGGVVVSAAFQRFDQSFLLNALTALGERYVGITQLPTDVSDAEILRLAESGVRGIRFNLKRPTQDFDGLVKLGQRAHRLVGWHVELHVDSRHLPDLAPRLNPLPVTIDHLGLSRDGFPNLLAMVERGALVKASGFGRGDLDIPLALTAIAELDPGALLFGTDLPSTRSPARPFLDEDISLVTDVLGQDLGRMALYENAIRFYLD